MPRPVTIVPHRITLRACKDLDWRVTAWCARCGYGYEMDLAKACERPLAGTPIVKLLEAGAIRCRTRCPGEPAHYLSITWLDVGISRGLAAWRVETISGRRSARLEEPPAD